MLRIELTVPNRDNAGNARPDGGAPELLTYLQYVREHLRAAGFNGWTELPGRGYWRGRSERVTVFVIDASVDDVAELALVRTVARGLRAYADQDAVYVASTPITAELI